MVKRLKITVNLENAVEESLEILKLVRKDWNYDLVTCKIYESGITNKMLGFYEKGNPDNIVLIRINGNGTDKFLDRTAEVESFLLLNAHNCAPEIYCIFENGLCYDFIVGITTTTSSVRDPKLYQ